MAFSICHLKRIILLTNYSVYQSKFTCAISYSSQNKVNQVQNNRNHGNILAKQKPNNITSMKCYCSSAEERRKLPTIMEFPKIVWPSLLKTIKNFILVNCIIRPYFDREFRLPEFNVAAKHAVQVVTSRISSGDIQGLEGLVTKDVIEALNKSVSSMSMAQRLDLSVRKEDVYFSFPYQIGIMFDDNDDDKKTPQKRFVEITMVYHALKGLKDMQDRDESPPLNMGMLPEYSDKIMICNYRFIKEFTQGMESDWTINIINHFKPSEYTDN